MIGCFLREYSNHMKRILSFLLLVGIAVASGAQVKVNCGPYLQNVTEDSFTVVWTTNGPAVVRQGMAWQCDGQQIFCADVERYRPGPDVVRSYS